MRQRPAQARRHLPRRQPVWRQQLHRWLRSVVARLWPPSQRPEQHCIIGLNLCVACLVLSCLVNRAQHRGARATQRRSKQFRARSLAGLVVPPDPLPSYSLLLASRAAAAAAAVAAAVALLLWLRPPNCSAAPARVRLPRVPPAAGRGDAGQVSAEKLFTMIAAATVLSTLAILVEANGIPDFGSKPHILLVVVDVCDVHMLTTVLLRQRAACSQADSVAGCLLHARVPQDLGWHNVGWHNPDMITPNADKLVAEGMTLDRSYQFWYCAPTRSSIMTGRLP